MQVPEPSHTSEVHTTRSLFSQLVHVSVMSHGPAGARHTVDDEAKASAGHEVLVPVQVSATSQRPATERHVVPALPAGCWHVTFVPSHRSSVQGLASAVHPSPAG